LKENLNKNKMKTRLLLLAIFMAVIFQSCRERNFGEDPQPEIACEWNEEKNITFYDLQLRIPSSGMSNFFLNMFPESDGIIRQLTTIINTRGDYAPSGTSKASIQTSLKVEGTGCYGEKVVIYYKGNSNISANALTVPFISNDVFAGEVTIRLKSDVFIDYTNNSSYQVLWTTTGNDPDNVNGNIYGNRLTYNYDSQSIIIRRDQPIIIDGGEQLQPAN
jgi:hypothetical protein